LGQSACRVSTEGKQGVVALFVTFRKELGFPFLELIRTGFPDAVAFERAGDRLARRYIEFEFKSSGFKNHLQASRKSDYVVCWEDDWDDRGDDMLEVLELRSRRQEEGKTRILPTG